jgi:4-amino-4-deoxy-L-arabinose transferase-like glycosyltransferase
MLNQLPRPGFSNALRIILFLALLLRAGYAWWGPIGDYSSIDGEYYLSVAFNLSTSSCYCNSEGEYPDYPKIADVGPTAFTAPAYPGFLAVILLVFGDSMRAIYFAQALLGTLAVWLCYKVGSLAAGREVGLLAALIHAVNPFQIFQVALVAVEGFTAVLLLLVVYAVLRWQAATENNSGTSPATAAAFLAVALGVGMLTHSAFSWIALFTLLYMAFVAYRAGKSTRQIAGWIGAVAMGSMILVGPWLLRNHRIWDVWMVESKAGLNLNTGFHDLADGSADGEAFASIVRQDETLRALNEVERDQVHRTSALTWMRAHPAQSAALMGKKALMFWNPVPRQSGGALFFVALAWSVALMSATVMGLIVSLRTVPRQHYLYGVLAMYIAPFLFAYVTTRSRIPVEALFAVFAAQGLAAVSATLGWDIRSKSAPR